MLSGTFARNQFSDNLSAEKIRSPDLAISVREATRVHSLKSVSCSDTCRGCRTEWDRRSLENISSSAFAKKTSSEMVWLKQLLMWVSFTCSSSLSFIAMTLKKWRQVLGLTFVTVQHVLTFPFARAMYLLTIHLLLSQQFRLIYFTYYTADLNDHLSKGCMDL